MYHVFLADDEPWALMALKNLIQWSDFGFAVSGEAEDGRQALERIERMGPDLIISDIRMPGMDGLETAQAILEEHPEARIVMVSSLAYDDTFEEAKAIGAKGFIDKPFEKERLLEVFAKAMGGA